MRKSQQRLLITVHTVLIALLYSSPFWLDWVLIAILIIFNYLQLMIFGGCVLTIRQFQSTEMSFQEWLWSHLGFKINRPKFNRFLRWQLPFMLLAAALIWQEILGFKALINL